MGTDGNPKKMSSRLRAFLGDWRVQIRIASCVVVSTAVWHWFFPHTFWFIKFWSGMATGTPVGISWYVWRFYDRICLPRADAALYAVGLAAMFIVAIARVAPDLRSQEAELAKVQSLAGNEISVISIRTGERVSRCTHPQQLDEFVALLPHAVLFYPSHEGSVSEFQLAILLKDGTRHEYNGRIPERHHNDIALGFRGHSSWSEILVPDCRDWLLKVAPHAARKD